LLIELGWGADLVYAAAETYSKLDKDINNICSNMFLDDNKPLVSTHLGAQAQRQLWTATS
jgi:hypothetical protein